MTRERLPPGPVLQRAYGVLDKFRISRTFFVKTEQEGCAVVASELNAANGIIPTSSQVQAIGVEQKKIGRPEEGVQGEVKNDAVKPNPERVELPTSEIKPTEKN